MNTVTEGLACSQVSDGRYKEKEVFGKGSLTVTWIVENDNKEKVCLYHNRSF